MNVLLLGNSDDLQHFVFRQKTRFDDEFHYFSFHRNGSDGAVDFIFYVVPIAAFDGANVYNDVNFVGFFVQGSFYFFDL